MTMEIKILGTGCVNCRNLEILAERALLELGVEARIVDVTDIGEIMSYGVMSTPALVIDEEVLMAGRVPSYEAVRDVIAANI